MASRPKSAGSSRSFLDDLLGPDDNDLQSRTSPRQRKSVRFFDEGSDDLPQTNQLRSSNRPHSSTLDSLLDTKTSQQQSSAQLSNRSKSDWLGLGGGGLSEDDNYTTHKKSNERSTLSATTKTNISSSSQDEPDWITSGLKARQSRQSTTASATKNRPSFLDTDPSKTSQTTAIVVDTNQEINKLSSTTVNRNWQPKLLSDVERSSPLSGIKRFGESEHQQLQQRDEQTFTNRKSDAEQSNENQSAIILNKSDVQHQQNQLDGFSKNNESLNTINFQQPQQMSEQNSMMIPTDEIISIINQDGQQQIAITNTVTSTTTTATQQQQQQTSLTVLQTKLRMLTLEKSFLEQTVEQMKRNHQDELTAMVSLYEQQMRLTSEMYKRHENMIQEERDRRIVELKNQLEQSEKEMNSIRDKYNERLLTIEQEYQNENKHLQEQYTATTKQMIEEHENELKRLEQRLRSENESSLQTSSDLVRQQAKSVTELMAKWEESAFKIEKLQRSVIAKQEEMAREQMLNNSDDVLANKVSEIEDRWKSFLNDMQHQRIELETVIRDEHEKYFSEEQLRLKEIEEKTNEERKELEIMRQKFAAEVDEWRQKESIEAQQLHEERKKLKEELTLFEERRSLLEQLYNERKKMLDDEQQRITKQSEEILRKQTELDQKESQLMKSLLDLDHQQQQLQTKKLRFDQEREQLSMLGKTLEQRAEELEKLSQMALKEKMDGINAMDEIERLRSELKKETIELQKSKTELQIDQQRLMIDRNQFEQQYKMLRELRDSIVCNLCGQALNRGNATSWAMMAKSGPHQQDIGSGLFYSLINGGYIMRQYQQSHTNVDKNNNNNSHSISPWQSFRVPTGATVNNRNVDEDKTLLLWQMAAQKDSAELAEETRFLKILMNSQINVNKSKPS